MKYKTLLITLLLAGCAVGPNYKAPDMKLPSAWQSSSNSSKAELQAEWWKKFNDPVLNQLIQKASSGNFDLQIAEARIAEARASYASSRADLLPVVNGKASANRQANQFAFGGAPANIKEPFNTFEAGFDASWELDLFGGKRREIEAANAELKAIVASGDDTKISLLAEVARTYYSIRQAQVQLAITNRAIESNQKIYDIAQDRYNSGAASKTNVIAAQAELEQTKSLVPEFQNQLAQAEYGMDILLGEQPGVTHNITSGRQLLSQVDDDLILAAPAKVIANRPDIRIAERKLAAATAQQGVAVAELFPDVSLSGFVGLLNLNAGDLLEAGSKSWSAGGSVLLPLLNYGRISADIKNADAHEQEALAEYKKSVITALSDVERSVTSYKNEKEKSLSLEEITGANKNAVDIANDRYKQGMTSMHEVMNAENIYYTAQRQLIDSQIKAMQNLVAVYKSLGGGWVGGI